MGIKVVDEDVRYQLVSQVPKLLYVVTSTIIRQMLHVHTYLPIGGVTGQYHRQFQTTSIQCQVVQWIF